MRRTLARLVRPWRRRWRHFSRRWQPRPPADRAPSPGVEAFLAGESMRQVAYFVGAADPGIIDPRDDWPGAVADAHAVVRDYTRRLQARIAELEQTDS